MSLPCSAAGVRSPLPTILQIVRLITFENDQNNPLQTPAPYAAGTGSVPVALDRDAFARMGYRERLALKKENPEVYKELRK